MPVFEGGGVGLQRLYQLATGVRELCGNLFVPVLVHCCPGVAHASAEHAERLLPRGPAKGHRTSISRIGTGGLGVATGHHAFRLLTDTL